MKMSRVFLALLLLNVIGCKNLEYESRSSKVCAVFSGFEYAGAIQSLTQLNSVTPGRIAALPGRFEPGPKYVFYHRLPLHTSEMETVTIPSRLRVHGFRFKPITVYDLMYPDEGGPLFTIEFSGTCKGDITNVVDRRITQDRTLSSIWASEAYIVEFTTEC